MGIYQAQQDRELMAPIVERLREARLDRGMTQERAAELAGMQRLSLVRIEMMYGKLTVEDFLNLCAVYNVGPEKILSGKWA